MKNSLGLLCFLASASGLVGGHPGTQDFHSLTEVTVSLRDPARGYQEVNYTEKADGHHIDGLQLHVLKGPQVLFDIDLHLNQDLLPTKYFQKYHHKVNNFFIGLWYFALNGSTMSCKEQAYWFVKRPKAASNEAVVVARSCEHSIFTLH